MQELSSAYAAVATQLANTPFAKIRYLAETASTNEDAGALLGEREALGLTIVTGFQRAGAGRKGRRWLAAPGSSLLFTTILPDAQPTALLWLVPFWIACVVHDALLELGLETTAQWPNDLLLDGRKLCGMLAISRVVGDSAYVACGVGINLHRYPDAENAVSPPPAFCDDRRAIGAPELLLAILSGAHRAAPLLRDAEELVAQWERRAKLPGMPYRLLPEGAPEAFEARALGLEMGGALRVERSDASIESVAIGDVRALR